MLKPAQLQLTNQLKLQHTISTNWHSERKLYNIEVRTYVMLGSVIGGEFSEDKISVGGNYRLLIFLISQSQFLSSR